MRIVAGRFRGRMLAAPEGAHTRPTSDRVREAVFNILEHGIDGFAMAGVRVLDLFAGTGALGLEALSRGAAFCLFVEEDAAARGAIRGNIEALGLMGSTKVFRRNATNLGPAGHRGGFGLAFLDPPYEQGLASRALASAAAGGWLAAGAVAVVEESRRASVASPGGFVALEQRTWGDTQVLFTRYVGAA
ncbi:MAG: 16S rRNA (guanine(966)-N(2))-methyltransferase RsmD [Hyphomicrobiaceae bacterium]|nr:16S rRNA (guanine(966)-N(2))-methyltransferase RsmD [Hyphomicrobiaceae bacterium]